MPTVCLAFLYAGFITKGMKFMPFDKECLPPCKALVNFAIPVKGWLKYKTFITQDMLRSVILADNLVYVCTENKEDILNECFEKLFPVFALTAECENSLSIEKLLENPVCHAEHKRLNKKRKSNGR